MQVRACALKSRVADLLSRRLDIEQPKELCRQHALATDVVYHCEVDVVKACAAVQVSPKVGAQRFCSEGKHCGHVCGGLFDNRRALYDRDCVHELWVSRAADDEDGPGAYSCEVVSMLAAVALELCELHAAGTGICPDR